MEIIFEKEKSTDPIQGSKVNFDLVTFEDLEAIDVQQKINTAYGNLGSNLYVSLAYVIVLTTVGKELCREPGRRAFPCPPSVSIGEEMSPSPWRPLVSVWTTAEACCPA